MKKLFIILLLPLTIISCKPKVTCIDENGLLTQEELSWLTYSGNEILIFKSNTSMIDTLRIRNRAILSNEGHHEKGDPCYHHYQSGSEDIWGNSITFQILIAHNQQPRIESFYFKNYSPLNNVSINSTIYNNVYIMTLDTTNSFYNNVIQPFAWRMYFTKANGILKYDMARSGSSWTKIN